MSRVGLIQMTSGADPDANLIYIEQQLEVMQKKGIDWVILPENAIIFGQRTDYHRYSEELNQGRLQSELAQLAIRFNVWLIVGSFPVKCEGEVKTTCLVFSAQGELWADYDKLHMFDVEVSDSHQRYRESDTFLSGNRIVVADTPFAQLGLSICYDVRFPELFSQLRQLGADVITVPAAFTYVTGQAHWEVLLRARAIETQCWIVAVGQTGTHPCGRQTWGNSMVIDPWGRIIDSLSETAGHLIVTIDTNINHEIREKMPVVQHARFSSQLKS
ncbi:carbon-nitrogen hydrolase family protein [Vibrio casei]|uniref:Carbon-nitrogen hydrolase family protein n=1 Tax=Vibrio casei TaxID=673372 RepID=A0A368LPQ0_9VIBR|nr:carbon-nitrogen hydrolase family protein [Vibrio casei]RCS73889.1 carbon-nitrogen hydrolase family protein [Vibrio casei]SJN31676.1 Predicted amidohydrolase / Aliphatic amidase AmiE [Vibrio casei]